MRDHRFTTRAFTDEAFTPLSGTAAVELRFEDACATGDESIVRGRDAISFPLGGTPVALRVESFASIATYSDATLGIDVDHESVRDVDVLPAAL